MFKRVLRPSIALLAFALCIAPTTRMYADCNIVTGCDPVPPPAPPPQPGVIQSTVITVLLSMLGLS